MFTMDCERPLDRDMSVHGVWGPPDWGHSERTIRRFDEILADEGLAATYFIVPAAARAHAKMWREIGARGGELGLHVHPQAMGDLEHIRWDRFFGAYCEPELLKMLREAKAIWREAIGRDPTAVRSGNFSGCPSLLPWLPQTGLTCGSMGLSGRVRPAWSSDWDSWGPHCRFVPANAPREQAFFEVPVAAALNDPADQAGCRDPRHLRVEANTTGDDDFAEIIDQHLAAPPAALDLPQTILVLTHNCPHDFTDGRYERRLRNLIHLLRAAGQARGLAVRNSTLAALRASLLRAR